MMPQINVASSSNVESYCCVNRERTPHGLIWKSVWLSQGVPKDEIKVSAMWTSPFYIVLGRPKRMEVHLVELRAAAALLKLESKCALLTHVEPFSLQSPRSIYLPLFQLL